MLHLNPTGSTQVHAVHFSVAPSDRRQFPAAISADEKFAGSAAVTRQERIRGFSTTRTRHLFVNSSIETEGGRKKRRVSVPSQHLKKMETCLTSYIPNFETLFLSRCLKKVFKGTKSRQKFTIVANYTITSVSLKNFDSKIVKV